MRYLFNPLSNQQFHFYFSSICVSDLEIGSIRERPNFLRSPLLFEQEGVERDAD